MIIDFRTANDIQMPFDSTPKDRKDIYHWRKILKNLREESNTKDYEYDKFYKWLGETWKIKVIINNQEYPGAISGIDVDDASYTMLLLRFPK